MKYRWLLILPGLLATCAGIAADILPLTGHTAKRPNILLIVPGDNGSTNQPMDINFAYSGKQNVLNQYQKIVARMSDDYFRWRKSVIQVAE